MSEEHAQRVAWLVEQHLVMSQTAQRRDITDPETLRALFLNAVEKGARRLCLCDTVGHICPAGVSNLVRYVREVVKESGVPIELD